MNPLILNTEVQEFIRSHTEADMHRILLQKSPFPGISPQELTEQIASREKARAKLPTWFHAHGIYYPNKRNLEQCSSEATAAYKARLLPTGRVLDLTGGFGVDAYYFSKQAAEVGYWETDTRLAEIAAHNFLQLDVQNISCHTGDSLKAISEVGIKADLLYVDPSRRNKERKRVFLLSDSVPDVTAHLPLLFKTAPELLVKTSPLLDLSAGQKALRHVRHIHVVAVDNEVKEVLWSMQRAYEGKVWITSAHLRQNQSPEEFTFPMDSEKNLPELQSEPKTYLYEPNAAIMKSGGFKSLASQYKLPKLHRHSHLYTSDELLSFPGRRFRILRTVPYSRSNMKSLGIVKANVSIRNFPEPVATIRRKYNIADGGSVFLFFTTSAQKGLIMIECEKI